MTAPTSSRRELRRRRGARRRRSRNGRPRCCEKASTSAARRVLVVSGGTTPQRFFAALSEQAIDWARVTVTLADERCVARRQSALERAAGARDAAARIAPPRRASSPLADSRLSPDQELAAANARIADLPLPADLVVLGMGDDGHTASWFPGADNLAEAIDPAARALVAPMRAPGAPEPRLTLTGRVILRARATGAAHRGRRTSWRHSRGRSGTARSQTCRSAPCCAGRRTG